MFSIKFYYYIIVALHQRCVYNNLGFMVDAPLRDVPAVVCCYDDIEQQSHYSSALQQCHTTRNSSQHYNSPPWRILYYDIVCKVVEAFDFRIDF